MLNKIKTFLTSGGHLDGEAEAAAPHDEHENQLAAAALLIEAAHQDGDHSSEEAETITRLIKERFDLSEEETQSLIEAAGAAQAEAVELHRFTHQIKTTFSYEERVHLVEMLWEVVYADGELHDFEANMMRRIGGLIHVSDRDRGDARKRVLGSIEN